MRAPGVPAAMIVCVCKRVSDRDIELAVRQGQRCFERLCEATGMAGCCGCCHDCATEVFQAACARHAPAGDRDTQRRGAAALA